MGISGLEGKISRRKKDESQTYHDPARELFEAELERVQKMQEQERQRQAEERERAIELARKEEEERERLAKEEEFLRLQAEEEARETAALAQRASEEAARKVEETRRAREERKRMIIVEEERRKEAARRKLLDLEHRIAQRESLQQQRNFLTPDVGTGSLEMSRRLEEDERATLKVSKIDSNEEYALSRGTLQAQVLAKKESRDSSRPLPLDSTVRLPADLRREEISGDKNRVVRMKRRENLDDGQGSPMTTRKYHLRDDTSWLEPERAYRGLPSAEHSTGPNRSSLSGASQAFSQAHRQERVLTDPFARKEHWKSGQNERFLGEPMSTEVNPGYIDSASERDNDVWWGRDNHRRLQIGQRLNSPPLLFHTNGTENDYPSYGRLRQSLPKQPRVPLPIFGRPTSHKQVIQSEREPSLPSPTPNDDSKPLHRNTTSSSGEDVISENNQDIADHVDNLFKEASVVENTISTVPIEDLGPALLMKEASDEIDLAGSTTGAQKDQTLQPDEIDQLSEQLSELTESEDRLGEDEKQLAGDVEVTGFTESANVRDGWLVQAKEEDMGEELCVDKYENEIAAEGDSDDQEWESSRVLEDITPTNIEHGTGSEEDKGEEVTWETEHVEDKGDGVVDDPEGPEDVQWGSNGIMPPMTERQSDTEQKDSGVQDSVKDHVVQLQNVLSCANAFNCAQAEGHNHGQSFLQHFQQPFSFMAVPLSQSTALNGVTSHLPMVPSMHSLQTHQELPSHLQMGLLPGTPLMPNAIQIGSIQMPLQLHHPQISPVTHLCHRQPPVFQFGQLCPFSQPLPPMQPGVQLHHAVGQSPPVHHHQAEFLSPAEDAQFSKFDGAIKKPEEITVQGSFGLSASFEDNSASSVLGGGQSSVEHIGGDSALGSVTPVQNNVISEETGLNGAALQGAVEASNKVNRDPSVGKIIGGRRRNNSARSAGVYGRGRGRSHFGKNHDYKGPYSAPETWPESIGYEEVQSRTHRQLHRRAEYKKRKPLVNSERDSELIVHQGNHLSSYTKDGNASDGLKTSEFSTVDTLPYLHSRSLEGSGTQHIEVLPSMQPQYAEFRSVETDMDNLGEVSLQSGVAFDFKEEGNEMQMDKYGDFIEVRSKRQLLREQRELRDKAKTRELKVKEQAVRKQQKVVGKSGLPEGGVKERWSGFNADAATNEAQASKQPPAFIGSGLAAAVPSESKASKSGQHQPLALAGYSDSGNGHAFEHRYCNEALGTTTANNAAWGVQRSSHEVVSLTQIQLEEALKPFGVDGVSTQMALLPERGPSILEKGIPRTSCSVDKVPAPGKTSVSMPGPISSLLAGEKIQFGAVTSPTIVSSASHPPSPSYVGAVGSQFAADAATFSCHSLNKGRNYFGQDKNGSFLSSKVITRAEDDEHRQLADSEAEAEAAASAIAVAAISNDDALGNQTDASIMVGGEAPVGSFASFAKVSALDGTGAGLIHAASKAVGVNDSISVALPADLSLETPAPLLQSSLAGHPVSSELTMQSLPNRASPFPCLDMGTILGGPIFTYGPHDDAQFEPGFASMGAGSIAGWQHTHPNTSDSLYGAPPPFVGPTGLPSIQGHPHMLVYTNPFTPIGQFGQLGVSLMGTAYHPSGKQPDWTHMPYTSSSGSLNQSGGDVNAAMMDPKHSVASNSPQAISVAGCSMIPVPAPMSLFDPNFPSSFQAQWSRAPSPPFSNYHHLSGPAPNHNLQSGFPGELGHFQQQSMHTRGNSHQLPEMGSRLQMSGDTAGAPVLHFSDKSSFPYVANPSNTVLNMEFLANEGRPTGEVPCSSLEQDQINPQSIQSNLNMVSLHTRSSGTQDTLGISQLEASAEVQGSDREQHRTLGHLPATTPLMEERVPPQAQGRGSSVVDYQRRGSSRSVSTAPPAERGPASAMKPKQIYVAKPATPIQVIMDST